MTKRLHIGPGTCVISLPGYEAGPATPEIGKAFDLSWPFTGLVLGRGVYADPTPIYDRFDTMTRSTDPVVLSVPGVRSGYSAFILHFFKLSDENAASQRTFTMRATLASAATVSSVRPKIGEGPDRYQRFDRRPFMVFAA